MLETYPASGSRNVPVNGLVRVLYCHEEEPTIDRAAARLLLDLGDAEVGCTCPEGGECLWVGMHTRCLEEVPSTSALVGDEVTLEMDEPLQPSTAYVLEAPDPGGEVRVSFTTGTAFDESPPVFDGVSSIDIYGCGDGFGSNAACPDSPGVEGFVSILRAPSAEDESGAVNIEYRAFQVRDNERIIRGRARGDGAADVTLSVFIPTSELTNDEWERICFTMTARDPYGAETEAERTVCELTPEFSPFGSACAVSPRRSASPAAWIFLFLALISVFRASSR